MTSVKTLEYFCKHICKGITAGVTVRGVHSFFGLSKRRFSGDVPGVCISYQWPLCAPAQKTVWNTSLGMTLVVPAFSREKAIIFYVPTGGYALALLPRVTYIEHIVSAHIATHVGLCAVVQALKFEQRSLVHGIACADTE